MLLNDLTRRKKMHRCQFRKKQDMATQCRYVWQRFFWHTRTGEPWIDTVIWEIDSTVSVRPACTAMDESSPTFVQPKPICFEVWGYRQEQKKIEKKTINTKSIEADRQALQRELLDQMQQAIIDGFNYNHAQKAYQKYNPDDRPFTVLATTQDRGLHASQFTVIWKNRRALTTAKIRKKTDAVKGKPLPKAEQGISARKQYLEKLAKSRKKEKEASRKYWQAEKETAKKRKPSIHKKLTTQIEQAEAKLQKQSQRARRKTSTAAAKHFLLSLDDGNQRDRILVPTIKLDALVDIIATYKWTNFDSADNRMWEYKYALLTPAIKKSRLKRQNTLWPKLNRAQKVFYTILKFTGETENGGVWQFLFNSPDLSLAALEAMNEIGASKLAQDYEKTLQEFAGKAHSLAALRKRFDDKQLNSKKRWNAFVEGYQELKTAAKIENYLFTEKFKKTLYKKIADYVEGSFHLFAKIKT